MHGSLAPEQLAFYDREGYLVLERLLSDADLRPAREAMERKVEVIAADLLKHGLIDDTRPDSPFETRLAELFAGRSDEEFLRYGRGWRDRDPGYFELMANPVILDAVESLIGGEIFANPVYNTRPKVPRVAAGAVPWHQADKYVDVLLQMVAQRLRSPGWYFHLERNRVIKVAYPGRVMEMSATDPSSIHAARKYGASIGIHPEQLHFERFMGNPFDQ